MLAVLLLLTAALIILNRKDAAPAPADPARDAEPAGQSAPAEAPEVEIGTGMKDGERYETTIILEGMESTVKYEHVRNDALGFEMDYDYELFVRQNASGSERFVSIYDKPEDPWNYLELRYNPQNADAAAAAIGAALSNEYDIITESCVLERAGSCIRIDASNAKGNGGTPDHLLTVYIVPASDGCRVAAAHCYFEAAEGFGRRFAYFMNSFSVLSARGAKGVTGEQALAAVENYCRLCNPSLKSIADAGEYPVYWELSSADANEIVVLFRSYTGAQIRYHVDPATGETYATELVPGVSSEETRSDETLNVWDYLF